MQPVAVVEAEEQLSRGRGARPLVERDPIDGGRRARISELAGRAPHNPGHEHQRGAAVRRELETVELKARHVGSGRRRLGEGDVLPPRGREEVDERLLLPRHQQAAAAVGGDAVRARLRARRAASPSEARRPAGGAAPGPPIAISPSAAERIVVAANKRSALLPPFTGVPTPSARATSAAAATATTAPPLRNTQHVRFKARRPPGSVSSGYRRFGSPAKGARALSGQG